MQHITIRNTFTRAVRQRVRARLRGLAAAFGVALLLGAGQALAATYTVVMPSLDIVGVCTPVLAGVSSCTSLRAAITAANLTTTVDDTIQFSSGGTINISSALPLITDTTTINGSGITLNGGGGTYAAIEFSGAGAINSQLQGMSITNFNQSAVNILNAANVVLNNNTITMPNDNFDAIRCFNSDNCSITGNTISNGFYGIAVFNSVAIAGYNATVSGNTVTGANYGVDLSSVSNATVDNNTISSSNFGGIRLVPQFNVSNTDNNIITNNRITGGAGAGIVFEGFGGMVGLSTLSNNLIQGNTITGNTGAGISFRSLSGVLAINANTITGNTITGNGGDGVEIQGANAANNAIYANTNISGNTGLGIDLSPNGVTLNDAGDVDTGPNGLQNFPVVTGIAGNTVSFTLDTTANASGYRIDFYNNPSGVDPTGYGEGQVWLGSCIVASPSATTPSTCTIAGVSTTTLRMTATRCLTAACTSGATSEFNTLIPRVTLTKALGGTRVSVTDQFTVEIRSGATVVNATTNSTSAGTGSTVTAGTGTTGPTVVATGTTYTLTEVAAGTTNLVNYRQSIACTNSNTGSATVLPSGTSQPFTVNTINAADNISCTLTNTSNLANLSITKTNTPGTNGEIDQSGDTVTRGTTTTYTIVVTNNGPDAITGAVVRDSAQAGLICNDPVPCTGSGCPSATVPLSSLQSTSGVVLGPMANGGTVTFTLSCTVQ